MSTWTYKAGEMQLYIHENTKRVEADSDVCMTQADSVLITAPQCLRVTTGSAAMIEMSLAGVMAQPIGWHWLAHANCVLIVCHMESVVQAAE